MASVVAVVELGVVLGVVLVILEASSQELNSHLTIESLQEALLLYALGCCNDNGVFP